MPNSCRGSRAECFFGNHVRHNPLGSRDVSLFYRAGLTRCQAQTTAGQCSACGVEADLQKGFDTARHVEDTQGACSEIQARSWGSHSPELLRLHTNLGKPADFSDPRDLRNNHPSILVWWHLSTCLVPAKGAAPPDPDRGVPLLPDPVSTKHGALHSGLKSTASRILKEVNRQRAVTHCVNPIASGGNPDKEYKGEDPWISTRTTPPCSSPTRRTIS